MVGTEIDCLDISPGTEIPEVYLVAILVREEILRHNPVLNCGGNAHSLVTM